ncbi:MAG: hypothetical protein P1U56_04660 [Saprospiraceae bacterium]|nr:hypothetical protein [Saprospiraceae bacterium]
MKNLLFVLALVIGSFGFTQAQDYNSAVGLRFGYPLSVTYKTFLNETSAVEAWGGFRSYFGFTQFRVNAGYLIHNELESVERLKWYYGGGAGLAFYTFDSSAVDGGMSVSISGYIGVEYTLEDTPVSFSVDWIPTFFIGGYSGIDSFGAGNGALSVRYVLN